MTLRTLACEFSNRETTSAQSSPLSPLVDLCVESRSLLPREAGSRHWNLLLCRTGSLPQEEHLVPGIEMGQDVLHRPRLASSGYQTIRIRNGLDLCHERCILVRHCIEQLLLIRWSRHGPLVAHSCDPAQRTTVHQLPLPAIFSP